MPAAQQTDRLEEFLEPTVTVEGSRASATNS
eukprot:COSAG02_NODE_7970_length_2766_cov_1.593551_1_plen_30_part_10